MGKSRRKGSKSTRGRPRRSSARDAGVAESQAFPTGVQSRRARENGVKSRPWLDLPRDYSFFIFFPTRPTLTDPPVRRVPLAARAIPSDTPMRYARVRIPRSAVFPAG